MRNNNQKPKPTTPSGKVGLGRTTIKPTNLKPPKTK